MEKVFDFDELLKGEDFTEEDVVKSREVLSVFLWAARHLSNRYHN